MKKTLKKFISFVAVLSLLASLAIPASAAKPEFMLAIGDSITTGYGLDGYDEANPYDCESYTNILAESLGLKARDSYINKAVNGATSADLLKYLPEIENYIGYSDLIVVTVGGNDLLQSISIVASAVAGKTVTGLSASIDVLTATAPEKFATLSTNTSFQTKMGAVLTSFATNLTATAKIIKENAPDARVIFLKQYNPLKNVPGFADFGNFADTLFASINASIDTVCAANGFEVADVPSVIDINAAALTNMLNYDIHPNADGHKEIAKLLITHLANTPAVTEPMTEPVTEPATEPVTEPITEPETTEAPTTETEAQLEAPGCFSSVSSAAIVIASVCALVALKKKEN